MSTSPHAWGRRLGGRPFQWLASGALALGLVSSAPDALAQTPHVGGFLSLDRRFEIAGDSVTVADFYNRLRPELSVSPSDGAYLFASLDIRSYDFPGVRTGGDLADPDRHVPTEITLWEGYVQLWDFLVDGLDLRLGRQRIRWGTADELNPTDVLNAYDFSDLVNFTNRIPTWAARAEYYVGGLTLTGVWSPSVDPPLLPRDGGAALFFGRAAGTPADVPVTAVDVRVEEPSRRLADGLGALKIGGTVGGADYSLSYVSGFDGIPFLERVELRGADPGGGGDGLAELMTLGFTRTRNVGADVATEIRGAGVWGEAALVFPHAETLVVTTTLGSMTTEERLPALDDRAYVTSTVGMDYTFPGGWYANAQWAHGLFLERGADRLHDYFVGRLERSFHQDEIRAAVGGAFEVASWSGLSGNAGYGAFPELTYAPMDDVELVVGAFVVGGQGSSLFRSWDDADQIYTRLRVDF